MHHSHSAALAVDDQWHKDGRVAFGSRDRRADDLAQSFDYVLPVTVARITGQRTHTSNNLKPVGERDSTTYTATTSIYVSGDHRHPQQVTFTMAELARQDVTLDLLPDGRLSGTATEKQVEHGTGIKTAVMWASTAAAVVTPLAGGPAGALAALGAAGIAAGLAHHDSTASAMDNERTNSKGLRAVTDTLPIPAATRQTRTPSRATPTSASRTATSVTTPTRRGGFAGTAARSRRCRTRTLTRPARPQPTRSGRASNSTASPTCWPGLAARQPSPRPDTRSGSRSK